MSRAHEDVMDKPLQPGRRYRISVVLVREMMGAGGTELVDFVISKTVADLVGPHAERIRLPIDADAIRVTLIAQVDRWRV